MTERPIDLDQRRGMAAQKATDIRRLLAEVQANRTRCASGRMSWKRSSSPRRRRTGTTRPRRRAICSASLPRRSAAQDPRKQKLIAAVLDDFARLSCGD